MNLQESIRRILSEEVNVKNYILRRYSFEELESILQDKLDIQSRNFKHYENKTFDFFMGSVLNSILNKILEELTDGWVEDSPINEGDLYELLKRIFEDNIKERFQNIQKTNLQETIRRILREETRPHKARRRTHLIDYEITRLLSKVYKDESICERYDDANMFVRVITEAVVENLYSNTFYMMDDTSEEWEKSVDFIYDYIKDIYGENLRNYFNNMCNERVNVDESKSPKSKKVVCSECGWSWKLSEGGHDPYTCHKCGNMNSKSELTEKCWAGYTQKGMKTMFGKRYPNCVKKTKK